MKSKTRRKLLAISIMLLAGFLLFGLVKTAPAHDYGLNRSGVIFSTQNRVPHFHPGHDPRYRQLSPHDPRYDPRYRNRRQFASSYPLAPERRNIESIHSGCASGYFREYQTVITVGEREVPAWGRACYMADGSWRPVGRLNFQ